MTNYSLKFLYSRIKKPTLTKQQAQSKVCQEIFIAKIGDSEILSSKIVFKGGLILDSLSNGQRGYTKDIDFDFIKYSLSNESISLFVEELNKASSFNNVRVTIERIEELRHKNYRGRRVFLAFNDNVDKYNLAIDIGVYKSLVLKNKSFKYSMAFGGTSKIQVNPIERMIFEKLSTFAIYGTDNSRDKDYFDAYYLITTFEYSIRAIAKMMKKELVINKNYYSSAKEAIIAIKKTFLDVNYRLFLKKSTRNWLKEDFESINETMLEFLDKCLLDAAKLN